MKKFFKTVTASIFFCSIFSMNLTVFAEEETTDSNTFTDKILTYEITDDDNVIITQCDSNTVEVKINDTIDGYDIVGIGDSAFANCTNLKAVELPDKIQSMGKGVFSGCSSLEKVKFTSGIEEIPEQTFALCDSLKEIEIPENVTSIGEYAFSYCKDLSWFKIPESIKTIKSNAFTGSKLAADFDIPENIEEIQSYSFFSCTGVENINIPKSLENIGSLAFMGCSNLKSYNVAEGNSTYSSENGVLYSGSKTILESYPAGKEDSKFDVPNETEYLADGAFFGNGFLTEVNLTENVVSLGSAVFSNCTALEKAEIPNSISEIPDSLFCDCAALWKVSIPDSVTYIGPYAFLECKSLKSIDVPDSVTEIGDYALGFYDEENDDGENQFIKLDDFTINANFETAAKNYAKKNDIDINYLDGNKDLPKIIILISLAVIIVGIIAYVIIKIILKNKKEHQYYEN